MMVFGVASGESIQKKMKIKEKEHVNIILYANDDESNIDIYVVIFFFEQVRIMIKIKMVIGREEMNVLSGPPSWATASTKRS